jgi:hypothetical protein
MDSDTATQQHPSCKRIEDLLLVLNFKGVCGEKILEMRGDLGRVLLQEAAQDPNNFEHCNQINEAEVLFAQLSVLGRMATVPSG